MTTWSNYGLGQYVAGEQHIGVFPRDYSPGEGTVGVLLCRSAGLNAMLWRNYAGKPGAYGLADAIADAGFPCISFDCLTTDGWGNDDSISRVESARQYLVNTFGARADKVLIVAQSMGAANGFAWAAANPSIAAGVVGVTPVMNLNYNWTSTHNSGINNAYGGAYVPATHGPTHDPLVIAQAGGFDGLPVQLWTSSDDTITRPVDADAMVAAIGSTASHYNVGALGHSDNATGAVDTAAVVAFLRAAVA